MSDSAPIVLFLCTGNAARSVMCGAMLESRFPGLATITAGTHVVEGMPMSIRTRNALDGVGITNPMHRSHQLTEEDLRKSDLVVGLAPEHVQYVRRSHARAVARTATLERFVRDLPGTSGSLGERVAALGLADVEVEDWEEVVDPAGGDEAVFHACAAELLPLVDALGLEVQRSEGEVLDGTGEAGVA